MQTNLAEEFREGLRPMTVDRDCAIIFVHVRKSGGTTLNRIIDWEYDPRRIFSIIGRYCQWGYKKLTECPVGMLASMQVFRGHMPFGLHRLLPQRSTYITLQRDPIERTVSSYFYAVNRRIHQRHHIIKKLTLEEFVRTMAYNNSQTKMIAGLSSSDDFLAGDCTAETLATAKANLREYFSLVGITERFEETLALAKARLGWKVRRYASGFNLNVTPGRPKTIPPQTRALIADYNSFDVEFYRYAVSLFDEALAQHADEISREREALQRARVAHGSEMLYYRTASSALRMFTLANSALRSMVRI